MTKKPVVDIEEVVVYGHVTKHYPNGVSRIEWDKVGTKLRFLREGETEWEDVVTRKQDLFEYYYDERE